MSVQTAYPSTWAYTVTCHHPHFPSLSPSLSFYMCQSDRNLPRLLHPRRWHQDLHCPLLSAILPRYLGICRSCSRLRRASEPRAASRQHPRGETEGRRGRCRETSHRRHRAYRLWTPECRRLPICYEYLCLYMCLLSSRKCFFCEAGKGDCVSVCDAMLCTLHFSTDAIFPPCNQERY